MSKKLTLFIAVLLVAVPVLLASCAGTPTISNEIKPVNISVVTIPNPPMVGKLGCCFSFYGRKNSLDYKEEIGLKIN